MTNDSWPQHSGSRWEPVAGSTEHPTAVHPSALPSRPATDGGPVAERRRRRGPALATLAAVLTLGASTAGMAYVRAAELASGGPATPPVSRTADGRTGDGVVGDGAGGDGAGGEGARGDGDRARPRAHQDGGDDRGRDNDHRSVDRGEDGQPS